MSKKIQCFYCRDKGEIGGCKHCGKQRFEKPTHTDVDLASHKFIPVVPKAYVENEWDKSKLINTHDPNPNIEGQFTRYIERLDNFVKLFVTGTVPQESAVIASRHKMGKTVLAYTCLTYAQERGLKVFPLFDAEELQGIISDWDRGKPNPLATHYNITKEDYVLADVLFIKVPNVYKARVTCADFILDVFSSRSRRGLPTYLISSYPVHEIARNGETSPLLCLLESNEQDNFDKLKYPTHVTTFYATVDRKSIEEE